MNIGRYLAIALSAAALWNAAASAQPVTRIVVSYSAGGPFDNLIRPIASDLSKNGEPFVIENKPGGSGVIAATYVTSAKPDGRTLLVGANSTMVNNTVLFNKLPYDPLKDLTAVGLIGYQPNMIVARADLPFSTLPEMVAYAKANPGKLNRASVGAGTITNLGGVLFERAAGIETVHVPYPGESRVVVALLSGEVDLYAGAISSATIEQVKAGKLKVLAVLDRQRMEVLPEVPSVKEFGYEVLAYAWYGLFAPAGTPATTVAKINSDLNKVLAQPEIIARGRANGIQTRPGSPADLTAFVDAEYKRWIPVIESLHLPKQ